MAIELCSESPEWVIGPRISFSNEDAIPIDNHRSDSCPLDSNSSSDFNFFISDTYKQESSSADELFSNGKILPLQIKKNEATLDSTTQFLQKLPPPPNSKKESLKEIMANSESEEKQSSKSFWRFTRSSSLNCSTGYKASSIFSLPLLSRSNSTGSNPNTKRPTLKYNHKSLQKPSSNSNGKSSNNSSQKPPLKKNSSSGGRIYHGSYGNGVKINPVLNVPSPYISKGTTNFFGLGYLFCSGKDKIKKKSFPIPS